jgi:hypothetical protein
MPWQPGSGHGFTSAPRPWLPDPGRNDADTVAAQRGDPDSFLCGFRHLLHLRRSLRPAVDAPVQWLGSGRPVIGYWRPGILVVLNSGAADATVEVHPSAAVAFTSAGTLGATRIARDPGGHALLTLAPQEAAIICTDE